MEKHAGYWLSQSDGDLSVAESLLEKGHYTWCLFVGHLILEKLLKAIYAREHTPEFKDKYRWRSGIEATFSEMDKKTGIKRLRVRGMAAVGYCALLAIGINIFRAAKVMRVPGTHKATPIAAPDSSIYNIITVKELFYRFLYLLGKFSNTAPVNSPCVLCAAA